MKLVKFPIDGRKLLKEKMEKHKLEMQQKMEKQMKDLYDQCILNGGKKPTPQEKIMKQIMGD